jgi:hypothetical protein
MFFFQNSRCAGELQDKNQKIMSGFSSSPKKMAGAGEFGELRIRYLFE